MPRAEILKNADAKKAAEFFRTAGIKRYQFVVGQLETTVDGRTFRADGVTLADGTVLVRLDSEEYSATQLAKHEGYHIIAQRNAEMAQRIRKRLVAEGKISKAQIDSYIDAYNAIYGDNTDAYVEEIVADAYAGINRTAYGTNNIRAEVTMEAGQWTKKSGSARAPPELQFSASAEQISEQDRENLNKVLEMMDAEGDGFFRDAVLLRNPKMLQKLVAEREKTESAAFTRWFGNSKAVNRNGEPLLVFHGAGARFTTFDAGGKPIWLTANIQYAEKYSTANRAAEKLLPSSSIYAGNVDRVIPAYIRVENPANVGDTDGGFDGNYMDLAKRIGVRPSELRQAWEEAGRP